MLTNFMQSDNDFSSNDVNHFKIFIYVNTLILHLEDQYQKYYTSIWWKMWFLGIKW